jgi:hypothetical protein
MQTVQSRQTGTSARTRHKCKVSTTQTVLTPLVKALPKAATVAKASKEAVKSSCVHFVCMDLRPFDTVAGPGFINMIQEVSVKKSVIITGYSHPCMSTKQGDASQALLVHTACTGASK